MPTGTKLLKCVMYQAEDMFPPKTETSDIDLRVRLYNPGFGSSCSSLGAL